MIKDVRITDMEKPVASPGMLALLQQMAVNGIVQTSHMNYILKHFPESAATAVEKPLIVAGLPRSGTTHLLQLLTTAPELIWMKNWEARMPFPSPAMLAGEVPDDREEQSIEAHFQRDSLMPLQRSIYDAGVQDSTEEIECMVHGCYGLVPAMLGDSPEYDRTYYDCDRVEDYQYLYR